MQDINVVIGDAHLGRNSNSLVTFQYTELFLKKEIVDETINRLVQSGKKFSLTFMGDMFHSESLISSFITSRISKFIKQLSEIENCVKIIFLVGNHDTWTKQSNDDNASNMFISNRKVEIVYDKKVYTTPSGKTCCVVSHCADENKFLELIKDDNSDYLYMHQEIQGFLYKGENSISIINPSNLSKYARVINGHIHSPKIHGNILLTGSIEQCNFGEDKNETGHWIFDHNANDFEFIKNQTSPTFLRVEWNLIKDRQSEFEDMFRKKYVRIFCKSVEDVIDCQNSIINIESALHIKAVKISEQTTNSVEVEKTELKSISDNIKDTAIELTKGLNKSEFKGFKVSGKVVDKAIEKINEFHERLS